MSMQPNRPIGGAGDGTRLDIAIPMTRPTAPPARVGFGFGFDVFGPSRVWVEVVGAAQAAEARRRSVPGDLLDTLPDGGLIIIHARPLPMIV